MSSKPLYVSEEIIDVVVAEVDLCFRGELEPLSPGWLVFSQSDHEPVFKRLCLTSKAFYRAAAHRFVRFVRLDASSYYWRETAEQLALFTTFCLPKWRSKIYGIGINLGYAHDDQLGYLDYLLSVTVRGLPALDTVLISFTGINRNSFPKLFEALFGHGAFRNIAVESDWPLGASPPIQLLAANSHHLKRLGLLVPSMSLSVWRLLLASPALEALHVHINAFESDGPAQPQEPTDLPPFTLL